jgi:hypothetical protein
MEVWSGRVTNRIIAGHLSVNCGSAPPGLGRTAEEITPWRKDQHSHIVLLYENDYTADPARLYTPVEAGAVSGLKLKAVHKAIDKHIVEPVAKTRVSPAGKVNRAAPRFLTGEDLVRLRVWRGVGDTLSAERRQRHHRHANPCGRLARPNWGLNPRRRDLGPHRQQRPPA